VLDRDIEDVSGGQRKRAALARALSAESDLLILDEPTNHLDIDAIAWLEEWLAEHRGGLLLVTHDRHVLDRVVSRVLEIDRSGSYLHDGGYGGYLQGRADRAARAEAAEATRANLAKRELAWLRRGAPARTSKSKARIARAEALQEVERADDVRDGDLDLHLGMPRLGNTVIEMKGITFGYEPTAPLLTDVDLGLGAGDRFGIVGANGAGKSTLLSLMVGALEPQSGEIRIGTTVQAELYDQTSRELTPGRRVREIICGDDGSVSWRDARLMERFWFDADAQKAPVELLSGGERRRLQLVQVLMRQPNVLLLDEPTNDLDVETLRALEDAIESFAGCAVVISHDRFFLDRLCTHILAFEGEAHVEWFEGNFEDYEAIFSGD
ncbi:MAG: ABC-F family ATP-binding cassette domain-containing protein, partial [Actinomycetota bacterium]